MSHGTIDTVRLGARGRLVLPAAIRERLAIGEGDKLVLTVEDGRTIRITSLRDLAEQMQGILKDAASGRSLVDELIAERRKEARNE